MAKQNQGFSARLKALLKERGMHQKVLAEKIGVQKHSVSNYCRLGRVPEWHILMPLAKVLGVSIEYLLTGEGSADQRPRDDPGQLPGRDWISLPAHDPAPLHGSERPLLQKTLKLLRSSQVEKITEVILNFKDAVNAGQYGGASGSTAAQSGSDGERGGRQTTTTKKSNAA